VHAHPDDETTKGGGTLAWLAAQGVRTVLVTCTDGSAGEVTNKTLLGNRTLAAVRSDELAAAASIMDFAAVHELGYADSGMEAEVDSGFANLDLEPLVERVTAIVAEEQPDIVVTYDPIYAARHPDHLRCHDVSTAVFERTCRLPGGPKKLYGTRFFSKLRVTAMHEWMVANGRESVYEKALTKWPDDQFTSRIHVGEHAMTARLALREHVTQVAHDNRWFYGVPDDAFVDVYPWEELELLATAPGINRLTGIESDLFEGLDS